MTALSTDGPVTVSVTRRARPERAREVRAWLDAGTHLAEMQRWLST